MKISLTRLSLLELIDQDHFMDAGDEKLLRQYLGPESRLLSKEIKRRMLLEQIAHGVHEQQKKTDLAISWKETTRKSVTTRNGSNASQGFQVPDLDFT